MNSSVRELSGVSPDDLPGILASAAEPLLLRGLVSHWPSVVLGGQGDKTLRRYLGQFCRDRDVFAFRGEAGSHGRYFYNTDFSGFNFERARVPLAGLLREWERRAEPYCYVGSTAVDEFLPGFREENDLALQDLQPLVSIWLGNRSRIAAHFDTPDNLACVVAGRRRFLLFPPEQLVNLYIGPLDFTPAGQAISLVDFAAPDLERFPRFTRALEAAQLAELAPADALYVPSMWWHHVEALDPFNVLVNFWWNEGRQGALNPFNALIHGLLTIKGLPAEQRAAWQGLFEHYVFRGDEDSLAHIPEQRRGILGELDETTVRQLCAVLRNKLAG